MKSKIKILLFGLVLFFNFSKAQTTLPIPYCDSHFEEQNSPFMYAIRSISIGTFSNRTNGQFSFPHYVFYNNLSIPSFVRGSSYPISLSFDVGGTAGYGVWIDYNQNDVFEESEKILGTSTSPLHVFNSQINSTISIPTTVLTGLTRMRVRILSDDDFFMSQNSNFSILPCNLENQIMSTGETEDYNVFISPFLNFIEEIDKEDVFIYPNPSFTFLSISGGVEINKEYDFKIFNSYGKEIRSGVINKSDKQICISYLFTGIYSVHLLQRNSLISKVKFLKL